MRETDPDDWRTWKLLRVICAMAVLEFLGRGIPARLQEIAGKAGMGQAETFRAVRRLVREGIVERRYFCAIPQEVSTESGTDWEPEEYIRYGYRYALVPEERLPGGYLGRMAAAAGTLAGWFLDCFER